MSTNVIAFWKYIHEVDYKSCLGELEFENDTCTKCASYTLYCPLTGTCTCLNFNTCTMYMYM